MDDSAGGDSYAGTATQKTKELHDRYGHVVRINPDTLSFTSSQAWFDIYGPGQPGGRGNVPKDSRYYPESHIYHSDTNDVDLSHWLRLLTTDIAGDVIFGEKFDGLENGRSRPVIAAIPYLSRAFALFVEITNYPWVQYVKKNPWAWFYNPPKAPETPMAVSKEAENSIQENKPLPQIFDGPEDQRLSPVEKEGIRMGFIIAGSETTATLLAGSIYLLLKNQNHLKELTSTLRTRFHTSSDMTLSALQEHQYLNAVLKESLRLYPPAPGNLFRRTKREGHVVMGKAIPSDTTLTMNLWAANRSTLNFHLPDSMVPERWIQPRPVEYQDDDRSAMKPFSAGPQDCPGRKLGARVRKPKLDELAEGVHVLDEATSESEMHVSTNKG
ncbi:isotrichodermin c-15 hydroxylase [Fusarium longipes]|uniref:Isotrichodermin c-15 hydroxylase n=1 Tax=Fusarium longipes TaxID=694270 RepID=A0A395T537_9HYPO|nr:isotrichodermin c-15 hydroxylase [Fusarium longipes]